MLSGCAGIRHAVPPALLETAGINGMREIRAFSGLPNDSFKQDFVKLLEENGKKARVFLILEPIKLITRLLSPEEQPTAPMARGY